jgi:hypothetical protein
MGNYLRVPAEDVEKLIVQIPALDTGQTQTTQTGNAGAHGVDQSRQALGCLAPLSSANRAGLPIGTQVNAREHEFHVARLDQPPCLGYDILNRLAP